LIARSPGDLRALAIKSTKGQQSSVALVPQGSKNAGSMDFEVRRAISADHPCLPGHFPGSPIVPGMVILDEVAAALSEWRGGSKLTGVPAVKFLAPLLPEQPFTISLQERDGGEVHFFCRSEGRLMAEGRLTCDPA
jgi:3-hydroxyacyl-[acyl-carrier-protein] dehydratase